MEEWEMGDEGLDTYTPSWNLKRAINVGRNSIRLPDGYDRMKDSNA